AMRALFITEGLQRVEASQRTSHIGDIAGDVGLYIALPLGALLLSEVPGPHHNMAHAAVQWIGRGLNNLFGRKVA
ncbi:MAG: hypothetical protein HN337_00300, partial [Deltaproteobacteria bacterium]|nr:hypothetical protein [Deltaproteobacteria bacterium]